MWNGNNPMAAPPEPGTSIPPLLAMQPSYKVLQLPSQQQQQESPAEAEASLEEKDKKWMQLNSKRYDDKRKLWFRKD